MASLFGTKTIALTEDVSMRVGGGVRYNGATTSRSGTFIVGAPSYTLVDVMAALDYRNWTLQLNAVNLFDEQYYPGCSVFGSCANGERSEEHTSELQSLMRISYAVFCLKKKKNQKSKNQQE